MATLEFEPRTIKGPEEILQLLGLPADRDLAEPDLGSGATVIQVESATEKLSQKDLQRILGMDLPPDLPVLILSPTSFAREAVRLAGEFEDVYLFEPSRPNHWKRVPPLTP